MGLLARPTGEAGALNERDIWGVASAEVELVVVLPVSGLGSVVPDSVSGTP